MKQQISDVDDRIARCNFISADSSSAIGAQLPTSENCILKTETETGTASVTEVREGLNPS